jgi:hypothetical protein
MESIKKVLFFDVFPFLCRLTGITLFSVAMYGIGFPPKSDIGTTSLTLFIFSLFLLLLPLAKKISLGKLLTFEKDIKKVQDEVIGVKEETRNYLNVYSNMITAISNTVNQTVNVHLPDSFEVAEAKEKLNSSVNQDISGKSFDNEVYYYLSQSGNDVNFALARLRMELEKSLRDILGKRTITPDPNAMQSKFLSARSLFKQFTTSFPKYKEMNSTFDYILKVCNAAIHGQQIEEDYGFEALGMGMKMLKEFEKINIEL